MNQDEINKIIDNLEGCIGIFDYLLTPNESNLLVLYIKELKQKYENAVADYETTMAEKEQLKKQLEENKDNYNCLLKQKEQFEYIMSKQVDYQGQRKEFINYLEDKIKSYKSRDSYMVADILGSYDLNNIELELLEEILQKCKEIIGGKE